MASKLIGRFSGLEQDISALEAQVKCALMQAGTALQDDMKVCLYEHIDSDVYGLAVGLMLGGQLCSVHVPANM